jgi:hypothetical protein
MQPLTEVLASRADAASNKQKMYNKNLPTYKKVSVDRRSKSLEPQSHLLAAACMSWVESTRLLHKDPPRLGKSCANL